MKIELVHQRDSDNACTNRVFVDGVEVEFTEYSSDPGADGVGSEFYAARDDSLEQASSDSVREAIESAFDY
ncbi:hypothetical protein [Gordonia sihwensis]|uniref:hypothetical protein n=1 Tax=Gordonia sihwensis TaxID=173559 RepID=UPI003D951B7C